MEPSGLARTLQVNGATRTFEVYTPADYDNTRSYPLVVALHGGGGTGAGFQRDSGLDSAVGSDAIVVYPDGLPEFAGGSTVFILDPVGEGFAFIDALLTHLQDGLCVDRSRIFATGWSMGGFMTNSLGCYRSDVFAGIASVSGGVPGDKPPAPPYPTCEGQVPAMFIHGTSDRIIPVSFGEEMRDIFVANNGCASTSAGVEPPPCVAYDACTQPTLWCGYDGGHAWPEFYATAAWRFFSSL
jgi:poly(3-hydroxybutyrate) depolymerase